MFENFSITTPSPGLVSDPNSFVSLFIFYILFYPLSKRVGCLSGCLVSLPAFRSCFVEWRLRKGAGAAQSSYPMPKVRAAAERSYPMPKLRGRSQEEHHNPMVRSSGCSLLECR